MEPGLSSIWSIGSMQSKAVSLTVKKLFILYLDVLSSMLYRWRSLEATVRIRLKTRGRRLKSKSWEHLTPGNINRQELIQKPPYLHWNQAPHKDQQAPGQNIPRKFSSKTRTYSWASINRLRWTLGYTCLFPFWFPQCVCPAVGLLGHKAVLFPVF